MNKKLEEDVYGLLLKIDNKIKDVEQLYKNIEAIETYEEFNNLNELDKKEKVTNMLIESVFANRLSELYTSKSTALSLIFIKNLDDSEKLEQLDNLSKKLKDSISKIDLDIREIGFLTEKITNEINY